MKDWILTHRLVFVLLIVLSAGLLLYAVQSITGFGIEDLKAFFSYWTDEIQTWPAILFFLMVAILPLFGFPVSPLFIIAGIRFGVAWAIPFSLAALASNMILAYWISTKLLHRLIQRIALRWGYTIPKVSRGNANKLIFVVRVSGAPLVMQNYILGLAFAPFWPYLLISMATQSLVVVGMIVFGDSFLSGNGGKALAGIGILVIAMVALSYFRKRYGQSKAGSPDSSIG